MSEFRMKLGKIWHMQCIDIDEITLVIVMPKIMEIYTKNYGPWLKSKFVNPLYFKIDEWSFTKFCIDTLILT